MAKGGVQVKGLQQVRRNMKKLGQQGEAAFKGAMYAEGLHIMDKAVEKAPAVTGRLRNSHWVSHPGLLGEITIGFATVYAAAVEYGLKLINASRRQQKAAFANMRESGWRKSKVGGPGFFRGAIAQTAAGRVGRVAKTCRRYFKMRVGFVASPDTPKTPSEARSKGGK